MDFNFSNTPSIPEDLGEFNTSTILKSILKHQPISRIELSKTTGISKGTVTRLTQNLVERHFVIEIGTGKSAGGRKPIMLTLNPQKAYVIGVNISEHFTSIRLFDFSLKVRASADLPTNTNPESFMKSLAREIGTLFFPFKAMPLKKVVVSVPGAVNRAMTQIRGISALGWQEIDISRSLKIELLKVGIETNVMAENNATLGVIAEAMLGNVINPGDENIIYVFVKERIDAGLILNGRLYRGRTNSAGEFGHTMILRGGRKCSCGRNGCWETYGSERELQTEDFTTYSDVFSEGVVNIVNALDPNLIIFGGSILERWNEISKEISRHIHRNSVVDDLKEIRIEKTSFAPFEGPLLGAGILGFWDIFNKKTDL